MIYLDNAATTFPKPSSVGVKMQESLVKYGANAGRGAHELAMRAASEIYAVRSNAAAFFGLESPTQIVFTQNATMALNTVIKGLLKRGDRVLISDLEHNSVYRPVYETCELDIFDSQNPLQSINDKITPSTRAIICTAASNVTGQTLPLREIAALARQKGLIFIVDGSQSAGIHDLSAKKIGYDFMCTAGHKGLYGPQGTGLIAINSDIPVKPLMSGGSGSASVLPVQPFELPERLEAGTQNLHGIVGLGAGLDFVKSRKIPPILHERELISQLKRGLEGLDGVKICGFGDSLLSFNFDKMESEQAAALYSQNGICVRAGLHCAPLAHKKIGTFPSGAVRVSVGAFNTPAQIQHFLGVTEQFLVKKG